MKRYLFSILVGMLVAALVPATSYASWMDIQCINEELDVDTADDSNAFDINGDRLLNEKFTYALEDLIDEDNDGNIDIVHISITGETRNFPMLQEGVGFDEGRLGLYTGRPGFGYLCPNTSVDIVTWQDTPAIGGAGSYHFRADAFFPIDYIYGDLHMTIGYKVLQSRPRGGTRKRLSDFIIRNPTYNPFNGVKVTEIDGNTVTVRVGLKWPIILDSTHSLQLVPVSNANVTLEKDDNGNHWAVFEYNTDPNSLSSSTAYSVHYSTPAMYTESQAYSMSNINLCANLFLDEGQTLPTACFQFVPFPMMSFVFIGSAEDEEEENNSMRRYSDSIKLLQKDLKVKAVSSDKIKKEFKEEEPVPPKPSVDAVERRGLWQNLRNLFIGTRKQKHEIPPEPLEQVK